MSSTTIPNQRSHNNGSAFLLVILVIAILLYVTIQVIQSSHAYLAHGPDAEQTRNCIQQNGVWKAFREPNSDTFHWLCQDPVSGTIFDLIVEKLTESTYREKTAFRPKDGSWNAVRTWLERKHAQSVNLPTEAIELISP
jgi:hypothetical protein